MRIAVAMPKLGYDMQAGKIAAWTKVVNDHVVRGDIIAEIETDKGVIEVEAMASVTLVDVVHGPGDEVPVGDTIAFLEDSSG